jgi:hypothetical protein
MTETELLDKLLELGIAVTVEAGRLHLVGPRAALTSELLAEVCAAKPGLVALLRGDDPEFEMRRP